MDVNSSASCSQDVKLLTKHASKGLNRNSNDFNADGLTPKISRKFWSAGDYNVAKRPKLSSQSSNNRMCVHPKFLHANATSHKWVFGALAELLDNAIDEVRNGATFIKIDKITSPRDSSPILLVQDDGGGMDPESLRKCMSFGFSDKPMESSIGEYGNGFKTSTMRLGADVIVFSRHKMLRNSTHFTQSVGLLSYTFLTQTQQHDVIVPLVDYKCDTVSGKVERLYRQNDDHFLVNLSTILEWSPFTTEEEVIHMMNDMGDHGTKVLIFNLWNNDEGILELDFKTDAEDILISGAPKPKATNSSAKRLTQMHLANRLRYSLRAYTSVLYLHLPENFKIVLRGREIEHHCIAADLRYCECIRYKPQHWGRTEGEVVTTIGFLEGSPHIDVHGFNIYHKNRLILPFVRVASSAGSRGRGVAGVLEANFIKPTHDKQGFERSSLYQKLETRLREMTHEYWIYHCHLLGYTTPARKTPIVTAPVSTSSANHHELPDSKPTVATTVPPLASAMPQLHGLLPAKAAKNSKSKSSHKEVEITKRNELRLMLATLQEEQNILRSKCLEYEKEQVELSGKERSLREELEREQRRYQFLKGQLSYLVKREVVK